jgi:hypothetical protein
MTNYPPPVYPKLNPEHRKQVMERFYKLVRETKWSDPDEQLSKPRGRKTKVTERIPTQPRPGEKYNWFDK